MLVSELGDRVKNAFGDEAGVQVDDDDIIRWVNDGQLDIVRNTHCLYGSETIPSVVNQEFYSLPSNFLFLDTATYDGRRLSPIFIDTLNTLYPNRANTNNPGIPEYISIQGSRFLLYVKPAEVKNIVVSYVSRPTTVTLVSNSLTIPESLTNVLFLFCMMRAKEADDSFDEARYYKEEYEKGLGKGFADTASPEVNTYPVVRDVDWMY